MNKEIIVLYNEIITNEKLDFWGDAYLKLPDNIKNNMPFLTYVTAKLSIAAYVCSTMWILNEAGEEWDDKSVVIHSHEVKEKYKETR